MWPKGLTLTIGLWFDRPSDGCRVSQVCGALAVHGSTFLDAWSCAADTPFSGREDLDLAVEKLSAGAVSDRSRGERDTILYAAAMRLPKLGAVGVELARISRDAAPVEQHPVTVVMEADVFGTPTDLWARADGARAQQRRRAVMRCVRSLCQTLDPAYAVVDVENPTPVPAQLAAGGSLGWDAYISRRVREADPRLSVGLDEVAAIGRHERWSNGTFYSGWFLGKSVDRDAFRTAWASSSVLVGQALRMGSGNH